MDFPDLKRLLSQLLDTNPGTKFTVDRSINDPWFRKGYKEIKFYEEHMELKDHGDKYLNAFDISSYSCCIDYQVCLKIWIVG